MNPVFDKDKYDKEDRAFLSAYGRWPSVLEKEQFVRNRPGFFRSIAQENRAKDRK